MKIGIGPVGNPKEPGMAASQRTVRPRDVLTRLLLTFVALTITAGLAEGVLRLFFNETFSLVEDERNLMYRYDEELGWFPIPNSHKTYTGGRTISASHNSEGFRGPEFSTNQEPRIVFLGDSFVWGVDVELPERFTEKLQAKHPTWTIYNLGVSGYGTDQEYLLLQKHFDRFRPQIVFLIYCAENDDSDNCWNVRHGGYYKPYCTVEGTRLKLGGIPVPRSDRVFCAEHPVLTRPFLVRLVARVYYHLKNPASVHNENPTGPILRDLQKYVQSRGGILVVGLTRSHPHLEEFLRFFKILYVDLGTPLRYATFGQHWTPDGHTFVADRIDQFLSENRLLKEVDRASRRE
jgi:hypothetical protein